MKVYVLTEVERGAGMVIEADTIGVFATLEGAAKHSGHDSNAFKHLGGMWVLGDYQIQEHEVQE